MQAAAAAAAAGEALAPLITRPLTLTFISHACVVPPYCVCLPSVQSSVFFSYHRSADRHAEVQGQVGGRDGRNDGDIEGTK
jgi:hypothetical protein